MPRSGATGFSTVINCMDGRIQLPVLDFMRNRFGHPYVDNITIAGPVRILANGTPAAILDAVRERLHVSVEVHGSRTIAVVAHHDCAGNPVSREEQIAQLRPACDWVRSLYPHCTILPLWVNAHWQVEVVDWE